MLFPFCGGLAAGKDPGKETTSRPKANIPTRDSISQTYSEIEAEVFDSTKALRKREGSASST
jgi:hypothetical protein